MEKKKNFTSDKIGSRNRNKNKNQNIQNMLKQRELFKKNKKKNSKVLDSNDSKIESNFISIPSKRDSIVVVPERKNSVVDINDDSSFVDVNVEKFRFVRNVNDCDNLSNKFEFIDSNTATEEVEELEELVEYEDENNNLIVTIENEIEEKIETFDEEEFLPPATDHVDINARKHISFESRIIGLLVIIVISFLVAGILIFKAITFASSEDIVYDEKSLVKYEVCVSDDSYNSSYYDDCLNAGMEYISGITERIPLTFEYDVNFNNSVSTKMDYFVVSKTKIYRQENGKILNKVEDVLVERTAFDIFGNKAKFSIDIDVPYKKYYDYVVAYNKQYELQSYADMEIVLYVDNGNVIKEIAKLSAPLSTKTFNVDLVKIENNNQNLSLASDDWGSLNTSYAVVGIIFVLFGLLGVIKLTNLICKVIGTSTLYQRKLSRILREYDRHIVISRGDYSVDSSKRLIKVPTFGELLDARNALEKPIVYVKVNNVKSEFYVEDSETIYKYTMKEADFEGK